MAKVGPITVTCPVCQVAFAVPFDVLGVNEGEHEVIVRLDRSELYGHLAECVADTCVASDDELDEAMERHPAGKALAKYAPPPPTPELVGRIHQMLDMRAYVSTGGSRACTMCGTTGIACIQLLTKADPRDTHLRPPCCAACGVGNTHPAPAEGVSCAEWATEHGAKA